MQHFIYSIHSFECEFRLTDYQCKALTDLIKTTSKGNYPVCFRKNYIWIYKYKKIGLQICIHRTCFQYYCIRIIVTPKTILNPQNLCDIFDPNTDDISIAFEKINEMLSFMGKLYRIENFVLKRIDLCVDTTLKDDNTIKEILCLTQKGYIPYGYQDRITSLIRQKKTSKKINRTFSFDIINYQGKQITLYNKYRQLLDIGIDPANALEAYGTLRIEVKLSGIWLKKYLRQYGFTDSAVSPELISAFISHSKEIIHQHIRKICCAGTHYKLEDAIKRIKKSSLKESYKDILIPYVYYASEHHSLTIAEDILLHTHGISKPTLQRALNALEAIDINPVTIGKNRNINSLEGLHSILEMERI